MKLTFYKRLKRMTIRKKNTFQSDYSNSSNYSKYSDYSKNSSHSKDIGSSKNSSFSKNSKDFYKDPSDLENNIKTISKGSLSDISNLPFNQEKKCNDLISYNLCAKLFSFPIEMAIVQN